MTTNERKLTLNLTRKAILLFAAIFIVEALYIGVIASMLWRTSNSINKTQEARVVVQAIGEVAYGAQEIVGELMEGFITTVLHNKPREVPVSAEKRLPISVGKLKELLKDDRLSKPIVDEIHEMTRDAVPPLVKDLREANWNDPNDMRRLSMIRLDEVNADLMHRLDDLSSVYSKAKSEAAAELSAQTSMFATVAIVLGFVVNALVAVLLYLAFVNRITQRLSKISHELSLVASKKQLPGAKATLSNSADEIDMLEYEIRKMSEHFSALQSKERTLFENVPSIVCAISDEGVVTGVSPGSAVLWGYDADDLVGKRISAIFEEAAVEEVADKLTALFDDNVGEVEFHAPISTKGGAALEVAWKARLSEEKTAVLIGHDVTDEVEAMAAIRRSEEEFRTIVDKMPISVITLDQTYTMTSVNEATQEMFHTTPQNLLGRNIGTLISGATMGSAAGAQVAGLLAQSERHPVELNVGFDNQKVLPVELNTSSYIDAYSLKRYLVTFQDISVRTEIEKVKQDFVAMISHDLRSPLTALFGTLETLVESDDMHMHANKNAEEGTSEQPLRRAKVIVSDLVNLINDFLDLEKFEAGRGVLELTKMPLREVLKEVIEAMPDAAANRVVKSASIESPVKIRVDHERMLFALTNFLSTVLQYSEDQAKVNVSVFKDELSAAISFSCPTFHLPKSVRDSCLSRYEFQPSAKNSLLGSSGLALALSRAVVQAHSGSVSFSDDVGTQSIIIQIPIA